MIKKSISILMAAASLTIAAKAQYIEFDADGTGYIYGLPQPQRNDSGLSQMYENDRYWDEQRAYRQRQAAIEQQHRDLEAIASNQQQMMIQANQARQEAWWRSLSTKQKRAWIAYWRGQQPVAAVPAKHRAKKH